MLGIWVPSAGAPVPVTSALGRSCKSWVVVPASANPLPVCRSAPVTALHRSRHRQFFDSALGVTFAALGLRLASVVPRVRLHRASPILQAVASSACVGLFKPAALAFGNFSATAA